MVLIKPLEIYIFGRFFFSNRLELLILKKNSDKNRIDKKKNY